MMFGQPTWYKVNIDRTLGAGSRARSRPPTSAQIDPPPNRLGARNGRQRTSSLKKLGCWRTRAEGRDSWLSNPGAFPSSTCSAGWALSHVHCQPLTLFLLSPPRRSKGRPFFATSLRKLFLPPPPSLARNIFFNKTKTPKIRKGVTAETRWPCLLCHRF